MPWTDDPEAPGESCPQCSATVLPSDWVCAQCGLGRADPVEETAASPIDASAMECTATQADLASAAHSHVLSLDVFPENLFPSGTATQDAASLPGHSEGPRLPLKSALKGRGSTGSRPRPGRIAFGPNPPTATIASFKDADLWWSARETARPIRGRPPGSRNNPARTHPSQVPSSTSSIGLRWHGGTFAPPPYLVDASTDLSQPVAPDSDACTPAAVGAGTCAHTPSCIVAKRVGEEVHPAQPPSSAAERLAALRLRVLAKASADKQ